MQLFIFEIPKMDQISTSISNSVGPQLVNTDRVLISLWGCVVARFRDWYIVLRVCWLACFYARCVASFQAEAKLAYVIEDCC